MTQLSALAQSEILAALDASGVGGARDIAGLTEVLLVVRNRVRASASPDDLASQRQAIGRCVHPLILWLEAEPDIAVLAVSQKVELLWNLYTAAMSRTVLADKFPLVCTNESVWNDTMTNLFQSSEMTGSLHGHTHWLIRFHDVVLMVLGMLGFLADSFISSGRWRFYLLVASTLCFGLGALLWYYPIRSRAGDTQFWSSPPVLSRARLETVTPSAPSLGVDEAVPIHAPPFPGIAGAELGMAMSPDALSSSAALSTSLALQVGGAVLLNGQGPTSALVGQRGVITAVNGGIFEVKLDSGLTLGQLTSSLGFLSSEHITTSKDIFTDGIFYGTI